MSDPVLSFRVRRCLPALILGLVLATAPLPAQELDIEAASSVSVIGALAEGADLVVYLNWQGSLELPRKARLVVLDDRGEPIAKTGLSSPVPGLVTARLLGFVRRIPVLGPSYQLQVNDDSSRPLVPAEPLRVRLACNEPKVCRFRFETGTSAPGALAIDWDLAELLDTLPVQKKDLTTWTAERAPELVGDARTMVWQLDAMGKPAPSPCQCLWVVARKKPPGLCGNGLELGLEGTFLKAAAASVSSTREMGLALQQRCWRTAPGGAEEVAVVSGAEKLTVKLSRPVLAPCTAPCEPSVRYGATLVSRAFAETDTATGGTEAVARWSSTLVSGGTVLFRAEDEQRAISPAQLNDRTQTDFWSDSVGNLPELILRSEAASDVVVPGKARSVLAVAGVTYRLEARGISTCIKPGGLSAIVSGPPLFAVLPGRPNPLLAYGLGSDTGQIRILASSECPPGTVP